MELEICGLKKHYGDKEALKGVDITLSEGVYGLLGPNGAGKSTMMNIITGNLRQSAGSVRFCGQDIRALGSSFRSRLGYMPQQQTFYPGFTVEQFLYYIASLRGMGKMETAERIDWALGLLALTEVRRKPIRALSGGMRQRLLLAQAILHDPDVLILDEPTAGLDPKQRIAVRNLIAQIALHKIVLISTHVVPDVEYVARELILLSEGQVLRQAAPKDLTGELDGRVWELEVTEEQLPALQSCGTLGGIAKGEHGVLVRLLTRETPPLPGERVRPTLEDVYLHYFGDVEGL